MDLKDLYRDVIIDHNRAPRNFRRIEPPRHDAEGSREVAYHLIEAVRPG